MIDRYRTFQYPEEKPIDPNPENQPIQHPEKTNRSEIQEKPTDPNPEKNQSKSNNRKTNQIQIRKKTN